VNKKLFLTIEFQPWTHHIFALFCVFFGCHKTLGSFFSALKWFELLEGFLVVSCYHIMRH